MFWTPFRQSAGCIPATKLSGKHRAEGGDSSFIKKKLNFEEASYILIR